MGFKKALEKPQRSDLSKLLQTLAAASLLLPARLSGLSVLCSPVLNVDPVLRHRAVIHNDAVLERRPSTGFEVTVPGRQECFAAISRT